MVNRLSEKDGCIDYTNNFITNWAFFRYFWGIIRTQQIRTNHFRELRGSPSRFLLLRNLTPF